MTGTMQRVWYEIGTLHRVNVGVYVQWSGWELVAVRHAKPPVARDPRRWSTLTREKRTMLLPPRGDDRWTPEPSAWAPINPDRWPDLLPEPREASMRVAKEGLFSSLRQRFGAVAEAAGEPPDEATRSAFDPAGLQWWMDPYAVTYSVAGSISRSEAEGRVMRAIRTLAFVHLTSRDVPINRTFSQLLAELARTVETAEDYERVSSLFVVQGRDHDDLVTALGWFARLSLIEQRVLQWRSWDRALSWRSIAELTDTSHERARTIYDAALTSLVAIANDTTVPPQIAAIREINRRWALKRSETV